MPGDSAWRSRTHSTKPHRNTTSCVPISNEKPAKKPDAELAVGPARRSTSR